MVLLSDRVVGTALLAAALITLAYFLAWLALPPFLAPTHWAAAVFPERRWAVAVPAAGFAFILSVAGGFVGCVLLREEDEAPAAPAAPPRGAAGGKAAPLALGEFDYLESDDDDDDEDESGDDSDYFGDGGGDSGGGGSDESGGGGENRDGGGGGGGGGGGSGGGGGGGRSVSFARGNDAGEAQTNRRSALLRAR